ncbi:MAG: zinc-ribbon domain-containing protein [Candidatus Midichloria sp.]|nr:MAG: zinc-ribbon domain-containing protein [Candidatus Midichloria sp.]
MPDLNRIIVSCESCGAKFYVSSSEIHSTGRFVRCTICEHEWLVKANENVPIAYNIENKTEQNIVLLKKNKKYLYSVILLLCSFLLLGFLYYFEKFQLPNDIINIQKNWAKELAIQDVSYKFIDFYEAHDSLDRYKRFLLVTISVENFTDVTKLLETVQVVAMDKNKQQLMQVTVSPHESILPLRTFDLTIKLPFYRIIPKYVNVIVNKQKSKRRDLFNQLERLIKINVFGN